MSLSERMSRSSGLGQARSASWLRWMACPSFKVGIANVLFERLGQRLFETQDEEQLCAPRWSKRSRAIMDCRGGAPHARRAAAAGAGDRPRRHGLGPIEPFLADATVTEVMVNGTDYIYVERKGVIERTERSFHLRRAPAAGHRPHRRAGRAAYR